MSKSVQLHVKVNFILAIKSKLKVNYKKTHEQLCIYINIYLWQKKITLNVYKFTTLCIIQHTAQLEVD